MKLEEAKKSCISCIYSLVFPNGKRYIGKTKNLGKRIGLYLRFDGCSARVREAINKFGWDNVDIEVLTSVSCKNVIDLEICLSMLEIKYIREYDCLNPNGYNVSFGGEVLGIPAEYITTDKDYIKSLNSNDKVVLCYDLDGNFVNEYPSISRFSYENGLDDDFVRGYIGKMKPINNVFYLRFKRYDYIPQKIVVKKVDIKERVIYKNVVEERVIKRERTVHTYIPALKYDMNGKFCGEYKSKRDACSTFTKKNSCDWGKYCNGYILFKKKDDNYPIQIEPYHVLCNKQIGEYYAPANELPDIEIHKDWNKVDFKSANNEQLCIDGKYTNIKHKFKVYQYTLNGELVNTFESIRDASRETGIRYAQIYNCLKGATKKAAGFFWKKEDSGNKSCNIG